MNGLIYLVGLIVVNLAVLSSLAFADTMVENITPVARNDNRWHFLEWSPIMLGAFAATALSSVLLGFGITIGLGVGQQRQPGAMHRQHWRYSLACI